MDDLFYMENIKTKKISKKQSIEELLKGKVFVEDRKFWGVTKATQIKEINSDLQEHKSYTLSTNSNIIIYKGIDDE